MKNPKTPGNPTLYDDDRPFENEEDAALFCDPDRDRDSEGIFPKIKEKRRANEKNKENHGFSG